MFFLAVAVFMMTFGFWLLRLHGFRLSMRGTLLTAAALVFAILVIVSESMVLAQIDTPFVVERLEYTGLVVVTIWGAVLMNRPEVLLRGQLD